LTYERTYERSHKRAQARVLAAEEERDADREMAHRIIALGYRALAKELHPDAGGSTVSMARLTGIRDQITKLLGGSAMTARARELKAYRHAQHIALRVSKRDGVYTLSERDGAKKKLGTYHSLTSLRQDIWQHHNRMLEETRR
jgi:hypothetical protein